MESLKGHLLVASADLLDPNFRRTVVLVTEHGDDGALGLILNRPAETTVVQAVTPLAGLVDPVEPVYVGGPVEPGSVIVLAQFEDPDDAAATIFDDVGFVAGDSDLDEVAGAITRARVFAGYAGWSAGQLDEELEAEGWIVEPATHEDVFGPCDELWSDVLRRKGGPYALLATMPPDPSMN
ncbi:MAG TPA: YqgE/AlgH family protein [Gaiellaceae bacterium]|nr:YqgE/AlgH family protein [Gaiellaceae bacterium]